MYLFHLVSGAFLTVTGTLLALTSPEMSGEVRLGLAILILAAAVIWVVSSHSLYTDDATERRAGRLRLARIESQTRATTTDKSLPGRLNTLALEIQTYMQERWAYRPMLYLRLPDDDERTKQENQRRLDAAAAFEEETKRTLAKRFAERAVNLVDEASKKHLDDAQGLREALDRSLDDPDLAEHFYSRLSYAARALSAKAVEGS